MRSSFSFALLGSWLGLTNIEVHASPVVIQVRQAVPSSSSSAPVDSSSSAVAGASVPGDGASTTLFQGVDKAFAATVPPATVTPSSGCLLVTQTETTITDFYTLSLVDTTSVSTNLLSLSDGLLCNCAGGVGHGVYSSFNPEGTEYLWCADGGPYSTTSAISTSDPQASAKPGDANNPDWADVSCDYGSLPNVGGSQDPAKMWNDSGANAAWDAMYGSWQADQATTYLNFSSYLVNYFHGPVGMNCDKIGQSSCDGAISCGQSDAPNAAVDSPAGYMILACMEGLHQILEAINTGIIEAAGTIDPLSFTKAFSPITAELEYAAHVKLILDIVLVVVAVALVFAVEAFLPALPSVAAAAASTEATAITQTVTFATIKTQLYLNFGAALGFAKDQLPAPTLADTAAQVEDYLSAIIKGMESAMPLITQNLFDTPQSLIGMIDHGAYWTPQGNGALKSVDAFDVSLRMQQVIWASALPMVWSTGTQSTKTFIITSTDIDRDEGSSGCDGLDPDVTLNTGPDNGLFAQPVDSISASDLFQQTFSCINNTAYWLLTAHPGNNELLTLDVPANLDQLDGKNWGGTTTADVISSSILAWKSNGNQNTQDFAFDPNTASVAEIHGIADIPVCSLAEAAKTAQFDQYNSQNNPNWPCPADGVVG